MVKFNTIILRFADQGEKTGWSYILVPEKIAGQLKPGYKKSFRVKGRLDGFTIKGKALLPMGGGDFIMPFNAGMRKGTGKKVGDSLSVQLQPDAKPLLLNKELMECLADEPTAMLFFKSLPASYQHYYSNWIESAKQDTTRTKRIALAVSTLSKKMDFAAMLKSQKEDNQNRLG